MKNEFYWCFHCERAFAVDGFADPLDGKPRTVHCPFHREHNEETLDWHSYTFGVGSAGNYPEVPEHGEYYPIDPLR